MQDPQKIWQRLEGRLPAPSDEERARAEAQWRLMQARQGEASPENEAQAVLSAIFSDEAQGWLQEDAPATAPPARRVALWRWAGWSAAAVLLLALALGWLLDASQAYPALMAQARQEAAAEVARMGSAYALCPDLCEASERLEQPGPAPLAVPEGLAVVVETGHKHGVGYYVAAQGGCRITVLTEAAPPALGEEVSFNARAAQAEHFGSKIAVWVEVARHESF